MYDSPEPRQVLIRGCLAGTPMFVTGAAFHWLVPVFAASVAQNYERNPIFRPWDGWTRIYMIVHPSALGFAFAWLFTLLETRTRSTFTGACFGATLFLVGALPVFLVVYASAAIPPQIIASWLLQAFLQYLIAGTALGRYQSE